AAFSPYNGNGIGFSESWGPRQPTWGHVPGVAGFLSRTQFVLRSGVHKVDIAFFRQKGWAGTGIGAAYFTNDGIPIGWTHGFVSEPLLDLPNAVVRSGRLAPDGPAYKALVVEGDVFRGREFTLSVRSAERILDLARAGLPVVFIGAWSNPHVVGVAQPGEDARLRELLTALFARPNVRVVPVAANVPDALAELGVARDVEYPFSTLMTEHRSADNVDLYYLANARHAENRRINPIDQDVWLTSRVKNAIPYVLDAWTGKAQRIASFEQDGNRFRVHVSLTPGQSTIIAFGDKTWLNDPTGSAVHAVTSEVPVFYQGGRLMARSTAAGTFATTLSNKQTVQTSVPALPEPFALTSWDLEVEDWQPGVTPSETIKPIRRLSLDGLRAWPEIPELQDTSGVGRYRTTVDLGPSWTGGLGAYLDLGGVFDTYRVTVNGAALPPCDVLSTRVDVGPYLRAGRNTIEVEVATTLSNRLRVTRPEVFAVAARQAYGLIGPVRLVPYREVALRNA
ncbi:glycosyl hydrolase, partial [Micromonospora sp. NPDC051296]|uniref:glycosyl hydrolase n=1 Tax=Micromonospora sp. NPDC051296 TaxID=3155046 RepID=UPI00343081D5